ncbi:MAG: hypothetical protein QF903_15985 [Planctomycetota bacterium]|nr:hypothetical protein [Planctomycetota bacterium]MDP6761576.1 hypothetical protein [Planctomycetota bacterium]MDP6990970.1 hypothetical protein [Planctomycetota bacterium]
MSAVARSSHIRPAARIVALTAAAASAGLWLGAPAPLVALLAAPAFLGAALGPLARCAPSVPSAAEAGLWAWLLSPAALALAYALARALGGLDGRSGACLALGAASLAQLPTLRARVAWQAPSTSARTAIAVGGALALAVLAFHTLLPGLRLGEEGLWHAGLIAATERALPAENPWLAGTAARHALLPHALGALLREVFALAPTHITVAGGVWAAAALPLALTLVASPAWRLGRRVALAVALALAGWNALAGWQLARGWLVEGAGPPSGGAGPLAALLIPGPVPTALIWTVGAWAAAAGALRHGAGSSTILCGILAGLAFAADPALGALAAGSCALAALLAPGAAIVRPALPLALILGLAPGAWLLREGLAGVGSELPARIDWPVWAAGAGPLLAAALPLVRGVSRGGRPIVALLAATGPVGLVICRSDLPGVGGGSLAAGVGLALGVLAGGGLAAGWVEGGRLWRSYSLAAAVGVAGGAALFVAGLPPLLSGGAATEPAVVESGAYLVPLERGGLSADAREAYAWLRERLPFGDREPLLLLSELRETQRLPWARRPHPAPLFSGLELWCDRSEPMARAHPSLDRRARAVRSFFELESAAHLGPLREAERLDRPLIVWVEGDDRLRAPGIEGQLERVGLAPLFRAGEVSLFVWPPELAAVRTP